MKHPILVLTFDRPDETLQLLKSIEPHKPARLYFSNDGYNPKNELQKTRVSKTRGIIKNFEFRNCEKYYLFQESNLGCARAVSKAVTWFFENETEGIILEDDCIPDERFFPFCSQYLELYRNDTSIASIGGTRYRIHKSVHGKSGHFSEVFYCWGWASWRRAWTQYDHDIHKQKIPNNVFNSKIALKYWRNVQTKLLDNRVDSWAYRFGLTCIKYRLRHIVPATNLVKNIGIGNDSTHTQSLPVQLKPHNEPANLFSNEFSQLNEVREKNYYKVAGASFKKKIKRIILKCLNKL